MVNNQSDNAVKIIHSCEVCDGKSLKSLLNLKEQPMCDDLIPITSNQKAKKFPLEIKFCENCLTAHQTHQIKREILFPKQYHYRASLTQDVILGMQELVESIEHQYGSLDKKLVLDIGCNDGSLLKIFNSKGSKATGIEPTNAYKDVRHPRIEILNTYFDSSSTDEYINRFGQPDLITFTNVFAHIDDLNLVIDNLKKLCKETTLIVIENHYLGSVLQYHQFDTFYHEHPRTYSFKSFEYIASRLNMNIVNCEFPERYNGNIRVYFSRKKLLQKINIIDESDFYGQMQNMQSNIDSRIEKVRSSLDKLIKKHGPLHAKAFPGRASIIINYLNLNSSHIQATYERSNSPKINHFIPGTDIPILDETILFKKNPSIILNLAWHIHDEISDYMSKFSPSSKIVKIWPQVK
jgi:SAM-dependent methyltransferase